VTFGFAVFVGFEKKIVRSLFFEATLPPLPEQSCWLVRIVNHFGPISNKLTAVEGEAQRGKIRIYLLIFFDSEWR
jgi:hypothetical protein